MNVYLKQCSLSDERTEKYKEVLKCQWPSCDIAMNDDGQKPENKTPYDCEEIFFEEL